MDTNKITPEFSETVKILNLGIKYNHWFANVIVITPKGVVGSILGRFIKIVLHNKEYGDFSVLPEGWKNSEIGEFVYIDTTETGDLEQRKSEAINFLYTGIVQMDDFIPNEQTSNIFEKITPEFVQLAKELNLGIVGTSGTFYDLYNITPKGRIGIKPEGEIVRIRVITNKVELGLALFDDYSYLENKQGWQFKNNHHVSCTPYSQKEMNEYLKQAQKFISEDATVMENSGNVLNIFSGTNNTSDENKYDNGDKL